MADGNGWRLCHNAGQALCNWLVPAEDTDTFCPACELNRTIPDLGQPGNLERWQALEAAKRRLIYALIRLACRSRPGPRTRSTASPSTSSPTPTRRQPVMTGHDDGLITINIAEADSAERERRRVELGEPYRTLLGHLRHEVGHYYWDVLVRDGGKLEAARAVFGDERIDYQEALERHYQQGAPANWEASYVSAYATMHPWEDFAETWTHYLHMVDTLDTAASFGLAVDAGSHRRPDARDRDRLRPLRLARLRQAGRRLAAADRRGQQPQPQHGPARPLPLRADARRRSRSCASSTRWCAGPPETAGPRPYRALERPSQHQPASAAKSSATGIDITSAPTGFQAKGTPAALQAVDELGVVRRPVRRDQAAERAGAEGIALADRGAPVDGEPPEGDGDEQDRQNGAHGCPRLPPGDPLRARIPLLTSPSNRR